MHTRSMRRKLARFHTSQGGRPGSLDGVARRMTGAAQAHGRRLRAQLTVNRQSV